MANAGWYNDEGDHALARWHDGAGWTDHVLVKADWEGRGEPPPPGTPPWEPAVLAGPEPRRARVAVGSAVVVAVLLVGGAALTRDGDGGDRDDTGRNGSSSETDTGQDGTVADLGGTLDPGLGDAVTGVDLGVDGIEGTADDGPSGGGTAGTVRGGSGATPVTSASGGVKRTETSTKTQTNPGGVGNGTTGGDQTDVGHSSDVSIKTNYTTTTAAPTTTVAPSETTPTDPPSTSPTTSS